MTQLGEESTARVNLQFAAKVIALVGTCVWGYSVVWNKINAIELDIERVKHELELNSEFRVKWPRGELGSLPDDAEQNMRLKYLEGVVGKMEEQVDHLRYKFGSSSGN